MKTRATAKTLNQAISYAFKDYEEEKGPVSKERLRKLLKLHVHDWIAQNVQIIFYDLENMPAATEKALNRLVSRK